MENSVGTAAISKSGADDSKATTVEDARRRSTQVL